MRIHSEPNLALGWLVGKLRQPGLSATCVVKGAYRLQPGKPATAEGAPTPIVIGDLYQDDDETKSLRYPSDFAPLKQKADVLFWAKAHAPGGVAAPSFPVTIRVGKLIKTIQVFGNRTWQSGILRKMSAPAPFVEMPITYENAAGEPGDKKNPLGKGQGGEIPNLEHPKQDNNSNNSGEPAGFGPIAATWAPRATRLGTYDKKWLKTRWPWLPEDFDWGHFNSAPRDQQIDGFLRGDEPIELHNLHPKFSAYLSQLPSVRARCFVEDRVADGQPRFREVPLSLDTLWIDVEKEELVLVWRGNVEVRTLKSKEVERLFAITESLSQPPGNLESYRSALIARFEPQQVPDADAAAIEAEAWRKFDARFKEMDQEIAQAQQEAAKIDAAAAQETASHQDRLRALGIEPSIIEESAAQTMTGLAADLEKIKVHNPELAKRLEQELGEVEKTEQALAQMRIDFDAAQIRKWTRESVQSAIARGESLAEQDLSELDLSGLTFSSVDFTGAILRKTKLSGALLIGARLVRADLTAADLSKAELTGAIMDDSDLTGANLTGSKLTHLSLSHARLAKLDLHGMDFTKCEGKGTDFSEANLAGACFAGAKLPQADFSKANLEKANFAGAELHAAQMENVAGREVNMEGADITGLHGAGKSDFSKGNFKRIKGSRAIFETSNLNLADFSRAVLTGAQFSEASLKEASFDRAVLGSAVFEDACLQRAVLTNANFIRSSFDRADLTEARMGGSNFYESGFWDAVTQRADFGNANLRSTLLS